MNTWEAIKVLTENENLILKANEDGNWYLKVFKSGDKKYIRNFQITEYDPHFFFGYKLIDGRALRYRDAVMLSDWTETKEADDVFKPEAISKAVLIVDFKFGNKKGK
jgi:hypothetical protein